MNKRSFLTSAAGAAGFAVLAVHGGVRAQESAPIRIGTLVSDAAAEPLYGIDLGMFAQAGVNVALQLFTNYGALQSALAGGAIDVAVLDTLSIALAVAHGVPFTVLAPAAIQTTAPTMLVCVAKSSPIRSGRELSGKTIAVGSLKSSAEAVLRAYLAQEGVDQAKVRLLEIPPYEMATALERGTVDAAEIFEPALAVALRAGIRPLGRVYDAVGPRFYLNAWVTTVGYENANTPALKRLVATVYKIAAWANANEAASGKIVMKYTKLDPSVFALITRTHYTDSFEPKLLQPLIDVGAKFGLLPGPLSATALTAPAFRPL